MAKKASKKPASPGKRRKPIHVPMHSVVHFVHMLHEQKRADAFVAAAKKSKVFMTMQPEAVDFVRNFLSGHELHHAMVQRVIDPCPGDPFGCHFRD